MKEKHDSVKSGHEEEVDAVVSRYNFHTHPKHCYINNNVTNGWSTVNWRRRRKRCYTQWETI